MKYNFSNKTVSEKELSMVNGGMYCDNSGTIFTDPDVVYGGSEGSFAPKYGGKSGSF